MRRLIKTLGEERADRRGGDARVDRITRRDIDRILNTWRNKVSDRTLNAYRGDLRKFGKWCAGQNPPLVKVDPAAHLKNAPRTETAASKRRPIQKDQAKLLFEVTAAVHPRDGMTAKLMLFTGLRESEVVGLQWGDLRPEAEHFAKAYRPKRKNWHTVYWTPQLREAMVEWQRYVESKHGPVQPSWYVVPALAHRHDRPGFHRKNPEWPMNPENRQTNLGKLVKTWLTAVGETDLKGRASHTLRRTSANLLGGDIRIAQTFLGHDSQAMTEIYLDKSAAGDRLREHLENFEI